MYFLRRNLLMHFFALAVGVVVTILSFLTHNNLEVPPETWQDIAVASSLRDPVSPFSLLWHNICSYIVSAYGIEGCITFLQFSAPYLSGILASMVFYFFAGFLPVDMLQISRHSRMRSWLLGVLLFICSLLFVCSGALWYACRIFSPTLLLLLLSLIILLFAQYAIKKCSYTSLVFAGAFSGVLAAQTPLGFVFPIFCAVCFRLKDWSVPLQNKQITPEYANPVLIILAIRRMTFWFFITLILAIVFNILFFLDLQIVEPNGVFAVVVRYFLNYFLVTKNSFSLLGLLMLVAFVIVPLAVIGFRLRKLCAANKLLPIWYVIFLFAIGVFSFLQLSGFQNFHFWRWVENALSSEYLLCASLFGISLTVFLVLKIFVYDLFFRNQLRLLLDECAVVVNSDDYVLNNALRTSRFLTNLLRIIFFGSIIALPIAVVPYLFDGRVNEAVAIVNSIARATAAECSDVDLVFTDGSYDAAVEVASACNGHKLKAISMMSTNGDYDIALRIRNENDGCRKELLKQGADVALRTWVMENNPCISNIAVQVGIELWRKDCKSTLSAGGFVMRIRPLAQEKKSKGIEKAHELSNRLLLLRKETKQGEIWNNKLSKLLAFGQWRLSRMCRMRSIEADVLGERDAVALEVALANNLDEANPEWKRLQELSKGITPKGKIVLTAQEGLLLALKRADFDLAKGYAERVRELNPEDVRANFALGMYYLTNKQYAQAEEFLHKCLLVKPNEPAILNNLAIVLLRLGRFAEAEKLATKALQIMPESKEIQTTLEHINKASAVEAHSPLYE